MTNEQLDEFRDLIRGQVIAEILRYYQGEDGGGVFAQECENDYRWGVSKGRSWRRVRVRALTSLREKCANCAIG